MLLAALGHEVYAVRTGISVLVTTIGLAPDAIFIGERLADFESEAMARLLRSPPYRSKAFLISFSAYADHWQLAKLKAAGFDGCLGKPFDIENLSSLLNSIFARISAGNLPTPWTASGKPDVSRE